MTVAIELLYFTAEWCVPCKNMRPAIETFSLDHAVRKIDVEENKALSDKYGIQAVPTFIIVDDEENHLVEWHGASSLEELIEQWDMCAS